MATTPKTKRAIVRKIPGQGVIYSDGSFRVDNLRASYPWVGEPQEGTNDKGEKTSTFSCGGFAPKDTHKDIYKAIADHCNAMIKERDAKVKIPSSKRFYRNGDAVDEVGERVFAEEFEGCYVWSARSRDRPQVRGPQRDPDTGKAQRLNPAEAKRLIYGGCYINMMFKPWVYISKNKEYPNRLSCELEAVQYRKKGERLGSARVSEEDIDEGLDTYDEDDDGGWGDGDDDDGEDL